MISATKSVRGVGGVRGPRTVRVPAEIPYRPRSSAMGSRVRGFSKLEIEKTQREKFLNDFFDPRTANPRTAKPKEITLP